MFVDLDGHLLVGGMSYLPVLSRSAETHATSDPDKRQKTYSAISPASWEGQIIRLAQRVHEVKELIQEDLHELLPSLDALGTANTSLPEHIAQVATATASYERICREYDQALDGLLLPFRETGEQEVCALQLAGKTI